MNSNITLIIKRRLKNAISLVLSFMLLTTTVAFAEELPQRVGDNDSQTSYSTPAARGIAADDIIRVGLYYANGALPTANLANSVGSGFKIGYYTDNNDFVELARLPNVDGITMAKGKNLYVSGGEYYESNPGGGSLLGAYHVELSGTYSNYYNAKAVADSIDLAYVAFINGSFVVRIDSFSTTAYAGELANQYAGAVVVGGSTTSITICKLATNQILFEYDDSNNTKLAVEPIVESGEKGMTWFKSNKYYGGFQYYRNAENDITVVNFVGLDDYVQGVVPYEMDASWSLEALKAQAVCARTYAVATTKHLSYGFDVCSTTNCQVYNGAYTTTNAEVVRQAVNETAGMCIYYNNELIQAFYHSSSGGATEDAGLTWTENLEYLKGKTDPYDTSISHPTSSWTYLYSLSDLSSLLNSNDYPNSGISDVYAESFTPSGNVYEVVFVTNNGNKIRLTGDEIRNLMEDTGNRKYFSRHFIIVRPGEEATSVGESVINVNDGSTQISTSGISAINGDGDMTTVSSGASVATANGVESLSVSGTASSSGVISWTQYAFIGSGWGHNVGMSQYGARAMAEQGYTYSEIIKFYYTGVDLK